jgi:hypothetical protein
MIKVKNNKNNVIISKRKIKFQLKILILEDAFKILKNINGGNVTYKANLVRIFELSLLNTLLKLNIVPKKIIAKKGIVIDNT